VNLLLLEPDELASDGAARLSGRRARHVRDVLRAGPGTSLRVGVVGGRVGSAKVLAAADDHVELAVTLTAEPPPRPGLDLVLAMPRPKALRRILPAVASLGVDRVVLVNAARVEKPYFSSDVLEPARLRALLVEGLEQARDTRLPDVVVKPLFRPFVEDELAALAGDALRLVAHPGAARSIQHEAAGARGRRVVLAVGPEGGWVDFELDLLARAGFASAGAGPRPLRVEVAVPYLLGMLARG
jgi:RsmE family RNA methyltransferase